MLFALHGKNAVQMSVLGYAICAAVITACADDPPPQLLRLDELTERARQAVCEEIGSIVAKPNLRSHRLVDQQDGDPVHSPAATPEDPIDLDLD
tara:strand:- start:1137 stop:1418 length:282 start_codon:yes stop_codon:yes gene_type:complete|eukprot:scaffold96387_cov78-Phaeocystis_antarctica.AAC.2